MEENDQVEAALKVCGGKLDSGNPWISLAAAGLIIIHAAAKAVR